MFKLKTLLILQGFYYITHSPIDIKIEKISDFSGGVGHSFGWVTLVWKM